MSHLTETTTLNLLLEWTRFKSDSTVELNDQRKNILKSGSVNYVEMIRDAGMRVHYGGIAPLPFERGATGA